MSFPKTTSIITIGRTASLAVFVLGVLYAIVTASGFLALQSPQEQIPDPYFTMMEVMSILIASLMAWSLTALFFIQTSKTKKLLSLLALILMHIASCITSCVHFVVLSFRSGSAFDGSGYEHLFSFKWPSVAYALDVLAWDWFYALSVLFAAFLFRPGSRDHFLRIILFTSSILSFAGLLGIPLGNMNIRNIGIIGYAMIGPIAFLLIGKVFKQHAVNTR